MNNLFEGNGTSVLNDLGNIVGGQNMALGPLGIPDASAFSMAKIIAWIVFGAIGFGVFIYGKKERDFKPLVIGIALMGYPYFTNSTFWLYAVGVGLCLALYFCRD